jgi:fructose/tagatose bisphosphate aldolase
MLHKNNPGVPSGELDAMVQSAVFGADNKIKTENQRKIRELADSMGIYPASIQGLYEASGKGLFKGLTVPAINVRGLTYLVARAIFRAALKAEVGAFTFEIARSEIGYTAQRPAEYTACVTAAAIREGFKGPVFLHGDHYQVNRSKYASERQNELNAIKDLIKESIDAGFYNIDIDASTLVDIDKETLEEQQEDNCHVTAEMTGFIRGIEPPGITISVGGEIGEIGRGNSTPADLKAFMAGYLSKLGKNIKGISKISVQTGTTHGGVVLPDGSIARVQIDFKVLEELSRMAKKEYGMGGAVQHGASTLPDEAFDMFPKAGAVEVHLATGFQNIIYDSTYFPKELLSTIYAGLDKKYPGERKTGDTDEQFWYKTRKRAFGDFKKEIWSIAEDRLVKIGAELESRFDLLFNKLKVGKTVDLVTKYVVKAK